MEVTEGSFAWRIDRALERVGVRALGERQACVVVFDTAEWSGDGDRLASFLDAWELTRAARFRFEGDRGRYVLAHMLWRRVLRMCLGKGGELPRVLPDALGQPLLPDHPGHVTSLSRSGPFVAVAVARWAAVGIDIECFPPLHAMDDVLEVVGTPAEREALARPVAEARQRAALGLWTAKEAVLKACGVGLQIDPAKVDTSLHPIPDPCGRPLAWRLLQLKLPGGLMGALAAPGEPGPLSVFWLGAGEGPIGSADWTL
ncbi:MAG: 4'-phosphopantetheinyl transferase superfamily protein [Xanthomonadaceae bacterium]|nr:4'-phosphopantetheinyl transferase superfamily protein [Xanthomonadaceae bacterium]MDE1965021.1 4'-phosphopantetheinyl transferase superfamily protein [Xanthomonadaceae bacterium]